MKVESFSWIPNAAQLTPGSRHGEALAQLVTGAGLVKLDGGGHELHPVHWDRVIDAIIEHSDSVRSVAAQRMKEGKRS